MLVKFIVEERLVVLVASVYCVPSKMHTQKHNDLQNKLIEKSQQLKKNMQINNFMSATNIMNILLVYLLTYKHSPPFREHYDVRKFDPTQYMLKYEDDWENISYCLCSQNVKNLVLYNKDSIVSLPELCVCVTETF